MAIRPVDVRRKEFKSGFRGYNANEVDDFLDEVADEFESTYAESKRMAEELSAIKGRLEQFQELEGAIREALIQAQQVAGDLRRNATREAELVVREAREQAHRILADSSSRVERVQQSYEVLQKAKRDFQGDFRHLLKTYLAVMDNADVASAKEIEASLRERLDTESIAAARQAAETQKMDAVQSDDEGSEPAFETSTETGDATQRMGMDSSEDTMDEAAQEERGPEHDTGEPEVEQEVESSSTSAGGEDARRREAPFAPPSPVAADEVDREEPMPAGEGQTPDEFFDKGHEQQGKEKEEEGRVFRASRFLRKRG